VSAAEKPGRHAAEAFKRHMLKVMDLHVHILLFGIKLLSTNASVNIALIEPIAPRNSESGEHSFNNAPVGKGRLQQIDSDKGDKQQPKPAVRCGKNYKNQNQAPSDRPNAFFHSHDSLSLLELAEMLHHQERQKARMN
jgi:hypothetical protein